MVIKSGPWGVITAHKVIKQLPRRVGTLEPGGVGPDPESYPPATKASAPGRWGPALSCLGVEQMMPGRLGAGPGEPGRMVGGAVPPFPETAGPGSQESWQSCRLLRQLGNVYGGCLWNKWGAGGLREGDWQQG